MGILPEIIIKLLDLRKAWKHDPAINKGIKSGVNSSYGTTGSTTSQMYCAEIAQSVTAAGRWILGKLHEHIAPTRHTIIYGDTDSCFVSINDDDMMEESKRLVDSFHAKFVGTRFANCRVDVESYMKSMLLLKRKNYAYMSTDGKLTVKGMAVVRRDRIGL